MSSSLFSPPIPVPCNLLTKKLGLHFSCRILYNVDFSPPLCCLTCSCVFCISCKLVIGSRGCFRFWLFLQGWMTSWGAGVLFQQEADKVRLSLWYRQPCCSMPRFIHSSGVASWFISILSFLHTYSKNISMKRKFPVSPILLSVAWFLGSGWINA